MPIAAVRCGPYPARPFAVSKVRPQWEPELSSENDLPTRDRWARLRFAIIGRLLAAPPADGDLQAALETLASRTWRHPFTGLPIHFGVSTIQRWYYAARRAADPMGGTA
jgi:putative transposase